VTSVSWQGACSWLAHAGDGLRLATEAEWEQAAWAGSTNAYYWGSEMDPHDCWYWENSASKLQDHLQHMGYNNAIGLVDMLGHVKEWCEDLWTANDDQTSPSLTNHQLSSGRTNRGGSFRTNSDFVRGSTRSWLRPEWRSIDLGFRVARCILTFHIPS
jgi:formylglycine-generating enzyme